MRKDFSKIANGYASHAEGYITRVIDSVKLDTLATQVTDTTGAGDAFWLGFYTALVKGYTVRKALQFGLGSH